MGSGEADVEAVARPARLGYQRDGPAETRLERPQPLSRLAFQRCSDLGVKMEARRATGRRLGFAKKRAQRFEGHGERRFDEPAARPVLEEKLAERRLAALAHELHMADPCPAEDLAIAIAGKRFGKRAAHAVALLAPPHADEVDDDGPGEIAEPNVPGDGVRGGEIDRKR